MCLLYCIDHKLGGNITMLSSTSLLHGNCVFNRNNTVATQQGMKTYWLCKSYRITMCRARCITHQGRVISATGVHNHQPHMKGAYPNSDFVAQSGGNGTVTSISGSNSNSNATHSVSMRLPSVVLPSTIAQSSAISQSTTPPPPPPSPPPQTHMQQHHSLQIMHQSPNGAQPDSQPANQHHTTSLHHSSPSQSHQHAEHQHAEHHTTVSANNNNVNLQTMMQSVLAPNSLMHLSNMAPILNPIHQHHSHPSHFNSMHSAHPPPSLQITPILSNENNNSQNLQSPNSPRNAGNTSNHAHHQQHSVQSHHHHLSNQTHQMTSDHHHSQQAMSVTTTSAADVVTNVASPISAQQQHIMSMPMSSQSQSSFKLEQM